MVFGLVNQSNHCHVTFEGGFFNSPNQLSTDAVPSNVRSDCNEMKHQKVVLQRPDYIALEEQRVETRGVEILTGKGRTYEVVPLIGSKHDRTAWSIRVSASARQPIESGLTDVLTKEHEDATTFCVLRDPKVRHLSRLIHRIHSITHRKGF